MMAILNVGAAVTIDPTSYSNYAIGSMTYTTPNFDIIGDGDIYIQAWTASTPTYFELEYYINDSYVGYCVVYDWGAYYVGPTTVSVSDGDQIKFRIYIGSSGIGAWEILQNDSSGDSIFTAYCTPTP